MKEAIFDCVIFFSLSILVLRSAVGGLAADHIAGLAFGGLRPHSPDEHIQDPNILIVHSAEVRTQRVKSRCETPPPHYPRG